ncbi:hypothetical protein SRABI83_02467 [Arthrobacter sp. Bi83]|jgi:hypothetical protein|nr:hypothetical protein SRABI83_02467 [Arthrobacter sp. Bi83]
MLGLNGCNGPGREAWTNHFTDNTINIPQGGMFVKDRRSLDLRVGAAQPG